MRAAAVPRRAGVACGRAPRSAIFGSALAALLLTLQAAHGAATGEGGMADSAQQEKGVAVAPNRDSGSLQTAEGSSDQGQGESTAAVHGDDWLQRQPPRNYTIQLLVSENRASVEFFARQKSIPPPRAVFTFEQGGEEHYALVQGSYQDRASAEQAAGKIKAAASPWVRSLAAVQQAIKPASAIRREKAPRAASGAPATIKDTAWLWSQNPTHYTLQLAAAVNEQAVEAMMRGLSLPGEMTVVQTRHKDTLWYVLVYGSFADRGSATQAIERLPAALRRSSPWPRSFAELQDAVSRAAPAARR